MNLYGFNGLVRSIIKNNSSMILSTFAGVGTLTTAYFTGKASFQAARMIRLADEDRKEPIFDKKERLKSDGKLVWKLYVPAGVSAVTTIVCIVGAHRIDAKKTLAAQTAFALSQRLYSEYRSKVVEEIGEHKDRAIRDKVAEDRIRTNPPPPNDILVTGPGNVLCCELYTSRYFASDMERLHRARNDLNAKLLAHDYATLDDWYYLLGLRGTTYSGELGWKSTRMMELTFSTILTEDGRPCLAFEYNYMCPL